MAKTAVCKLMLGKTRDAGWLVYDSVTYAFNELTNSEVRRLIMEEGVNGLEINSRGEIVLDRRFYLTRNMMARSGVGRYHLTGEAEALDTDEIFFLTKVMHFPNDTIYEVVNNKCARLPFRESTIKRLFAEEILNGATVIDDEIIPCEGVDIEDMRGGESNADSLPDSGAFDLSGTVIPEIGGTVDADSANLSCDVGFDDISDWLHPESEEKQEEEKPAADEKKAETKEKLPRAKKVKKGAAK